ncbi:MAG TPA: helicase C-terminal domain-containing protein [Dictyobacter sp.]|nr:helicase C-terminal domain-containing protein [Dictyobacter sp.]
MAEVELQYVGSYALTELLSESSTSTTYKGISRKNKKHGIIKKFSIPFTTPEQKTAFLARAKQIKKLSHRNIVPLVEANCIESDYGYLIFATMPDESLREQIGVGTLLSPEKVREYLSPLADALHYAHTHNVVHTNLHPGIFLPSDKKNPVLLTGFAFALDDDELALPYMAPEQLQGHPTPASDQYALAAIVYEWLCGQRPFATTARTQQEPITAPSLLNKAVSPTIEQILLRALSFDPEQRFAHVQEFANAYLHALMGLPLLSERIVAPTTCSAPTASPLPPPTRVTTARADKSGTKKSTRNTNKKSEIAPSNSAEHTINTDEPIQVNNIASTTSISFATTNAQSQRQEPSAEVLAPTHTIDSRPSETPITNLTDISTTPIAPSADEIEEDEPGPETTEVSRAPSAFDEIISGTRLQRIVNKDLQQGGVLSRRLTGYEERPAQIEMASVVSHAITQNTPAIIEAATGTGKSLAYLVPAVRSGKVAIISTANKALQEQLFYKDIPFVQQHIKPFEAALVKGINNYICLDRVENERMGMQFFTKNRDFQRLYEFISDDEESIHFNGDFETLDFPIPADIRGHIAADSDQCAWSKCALFEDCYVREMRERAQHAQIIVVNHTLLLLDAAIGGFLLPERDMIILDEAHHLEDEATRSFTLSITPNRIRSLLAQRLLKHHSQLSLQDETVRAAEKLWAQLQQLVDGSPKGRVNMDTPIEEGLHLATVLTDLTGSLRRQRPKDLSERDGQLYDKLLKRTQKLADEVRTVFSVDQQDTFVYYIERAISTRTLEYHASAAPLDVTDWLKERLFDKCNVISTSATIATVGPNPVIPGEKGPNFAYFRRRIGLDPIERQDVLESILPLTFDYPNNSLLYIPRELPAPTYASGSNDYMTAIAREMYRLVKLSRGRAFLLFSSKRMLDHAYTLISENKRDDFYYPLLKQGELSRMELTRRFREEEGAVLFGLKSFWEGVDIAGDALSLVVIDKLPFDPPDDPIHEARITRMKDAGENWFGEYVLPQAVLRLKQGLGRLLRTRTDRGVMAILDTRLHTKQYGRQVLDALPPARRTTNVRDVERFFHI